jgi:hypothetical protein
MATAVKYESFVQFLANEEVDIFGTTDTFKAALHSDAPVVATDDELADLTQVTGTGYTAGGDDIQNDGTRTGGTVTMTAVDHTWTAGAADWGAARYMAIHDDTSTTDILMFDYDYGGNFTLGSGETFTADYGASLATLA